MGKGHSSEVSTTSCLGVSISRARKDLHVIAGFMAGMESRNETIRYLEK